MTIEERFERLEKQNRKLRKLSLVSIALAVAALIGGTALSVRAWTAGIEPSFIKTSKIFLIDNYGKERIILDSVNAKIYFKSGTGAVVKTLP